MMSELIKIKDLKKYYNIGKDNEVFVLKGIDLSVERGETVAFVGASGSGKSTLLHIIGAMDKATCGNFSFNGKNMTCLSNDSLAEIRANDIGFVFQQYGLLNESSVEENLKLALCFLSDKSFVKSADKNVGRILTEFGIQELRHRKVRELSGGQKQRVAIARALIKRPCMIIADEPTGALDKDTSEEVIEVLLKKTKEYKATLLIATHDFNIIDRFDRVIKIENGALIENYRRSSN